MMDDNGTISLEEAQRKIEELEAITKKRYRIMSIPFQRKIIDWVTIIVPENMTAKDFEMLTEKLEYAGKLLCVPDPLKEEK